MEYKVYKLSFLTPVHFGKDSLEDSEYSFGADLLFSALCHEAIKMSEDHLNLLLDAVTNGSLRFTDAFPYIGNQMMIPKPYVLVNKEDCGDSIIKKAFKKLKYIPVLKLEEYLNGDFDVLNAPNVDRLGNSNVKISVAIEGLEEPMPYEVGLFGFNDGCGLYFIVSYSNENEIQLVDSLVESLSYAGIGGKRSSGYGRFEYINETLDDSVVCRLSASGSKYMSLTTSLPKDYELDEVIADAEYSLVKRSGFVSSLTYSNKQLRKKDLYMLKSGSCFTKIYEGDVFDVSTSEGAHPVYRYAKPLFMEVSV